MYKIFKKKYINARMLLSNPQKKGIIKKVRIQTPRKPNSARRQAFKVLIFNNKYTVASIKGKGHNLKKHLRVLIAGRGSRDLPGVFCHCVRNVYDLKGVNNKKNRRSIYGVKKKTLL